MGPAITCHGPHRNLLASGPFPAAYLRSTDQADRGTSFANQIRQRQQQQLATVKYHCEGTVSMNYAHPTSLRLLVVTGVLSLLLVGCNKSEPDGVAVHPAAGKIVFRGKPAAGAMVRPPSEGQDTCCGTQSTCLRPARRHVLAVDIPTQRRCTRGDVHPHSAVVPTGESPRRPCAGAECAATEVRNTQDIGHRSEDRIGHEPVARSAASLIEIEIALRPW